MSCRLLLKAGMAAPDDDERAREVRPWKGGWMGFLAARSLVRALWWRSTASGPSIGVILLDKPA